MDQTTDARPRAELRLMDIVPILPPSTKIYDNTLFWPGLLTAVAAALLFFIRGTPELYFRIVAYYIVLVAILIFYLNSGAHKRLGAMIYAGAITAVILWEPHLLAVFVFIFKQLPNVHPPETQSFLSKFQYYFLVAGLMEELIKAIPALVGLLIALGFGLLGQNGVFYRFFSGIMVRKPMDGILMGIAAGASFTLIETLERYIPKVSAERARILQDMLFAQGGSMDPKTAELVMEISKIAADNAGVNESFFLLMPRVLGSLAGHMSYAAVFGYFIGLAALRRSKILLLLLVGWLAASALHAAWDAASGTVALLTLAASSFLALLVYFLKARALSLEPRDGISEQALHT
jgi:RsiW-degrading membrane proteinase PrsW (M82 family)